MAQFIVYENKNLQSKQTIPLLLDIQSNLLDELNTTVVVPLCIYDKNKNREITRLTPVLIINNENYLMLTPQLAGIHRKELGSAIASVEAMSSDIISAIDFLLSGF